METIKKYANHRILVFLYLFLLTVLFFKVYDRVFDKKVHLGGDNAGYYIYGKSLAKGEGYTAIHTPEKTKANHFPPGYPALIAVVMKTFSGKIDTIKSANGFYLLAALFALFFLFRALTKNIHLSFVACLFALYNYHLLQYSTIMMSELSYVLFSTLSLVFFAFTDFKKKFYKNWMFLLFALTLVFSFYIRTLGISLFISFLLILLIQKHWKYAALLTGIFIFLITPWQIRSHSLGGNAYVKQLFLKNPYRPELGKMELADWVKRVKINTNRYLAIEITNATLPFETINYKEIKKLLDPVELDSVAQAKADLALKASNEKAAKAAKEEPAKKTTKQVPIVQNPKADIVPSDYVFTCILLLLMAIGLYRLKEHRVLIGLYIAGTFAILLLWPQAWFGVRFMLPLIPILAFLALYGTIEIPVIAFSLLKKKEPWALAVILPFLIFYPVYGKFEKRVVELEKQAKGIYINKFKNYFDIATWSSKNLDKDAIVSCRKPQLFYLYANRYVASFKSTLDKELLLSTLHEKGVTHVVLDQLGYSSTTRYLYPAIKRYPGKFKTIHQLKNPDTYIMEFHYDLGYTGEWKEDKKHGKGVFRWNNGMSYEGDWVENKRSGQGKFSWPNKQVFDGTWVNDRRNGKGTLLLVDSTRIEGTWKNDILNGPVKLYNKKGEFVENATFKNNVRVP